MPELPEVETVKNILLPLIKGKTIKKVDIFYDNLIKSDINEFKEIIQNKTILDIERYAKYLFFKLSDSYTLICHLRMEGKFFYNETREHARKTSTTLIFSFLDNTYLSFNDTRKFGIMYLCKNDEVNNLEMIKKLGIEANNVKKEDIPLLLKKFNRKKHIKELLLDQTILSGIGNIYADEILFKSKINPLTKGSDLSEQEIIEIINNSKIILDNAIKLGGSSVHSFSASGIDGKFQNELKIYDKENEPCPVCGTRIHKIYLGGRGTSFCPNCQIDHSIKKAIGITGPIGSGKSTCLKHLKEKGYLCISSDEEIHKLYKDPLINKKVSKIYGFNFDIDNQNDRLKAKNILCNDIKKKKDIENLLYPELEKILIKYIKENELVAIEVPLLFKAHFEYLFKTIIVLKISKDQQIKNLNNRNERNIKDSLKINNDFYYDKNNKDVKIIETNGDLNYLYNQIDLIIK